MLLVYFDNLILKSVRHLKNDNNHLFQPGCLCDSVEGGLAHVARVAERLVHRHLHSLLLLPPPCFFLNFCCCWCCSGALEYRQIDCIKEKTNTPPTNSHTHIKKVVLFSICRKVETSLQKNCDKSAQVMKI